jgi:hypothetical protein
MVLTVDRGPMERFQNIFAEKIGEKIGEKIAEKIGVFTQNTAGFCKNCL